MKNTFIKGFKAVATLSILSLVLGGLFINTKSADAILMASVSITASPSTICVGESAEINWSSIDATSVSITGMGNVATFGSATVSPTTTTTYTITGTNSTGGYATASAYVHVNSGSSCNTQPPQNTMVSVSITASPSDVCSGEPADINWSSINATNVSISNIGTVGTSGNRTVYPTRTTTYTITGTNSSGGYGTASAYVNVDTSPSCGGEISIPTVNLTADDANLNYGDNTVLRWTSVNATTCTATSGINGWAGSKNLSGSFNTSSLYATRTYNISCSNNYGSASDSVTVYVDDNNQGDAPTVNLTADDTSIDYDDNTTLRWTSTDADTCRANSGDNGWAGSRNVSGSFNTGNLTDTTYYSITCTNDYGSSSDSVTVRVDDNNDNNNDNEPDVTTRSATNVDENGATLNGRVDGNGSSTRAWFEYGTSYNLSSTTNENSYGSGSKNYSKSISNLRPNTTYYFRAVAENSSDTVYGSVLSFRTDGGNIIYNNDRPTVAVYADNTDLVYNGATTVRWNTVNATSCSATGGSTGWSGAKSIGPASFYTGSLTSTKVYTLTCSNGYGSDTASVTVNVRGRVNNPTVRPTPTSLVLITSSVDRNQPIVPTIDNTRPHPGDEINYTVSYQNIGTGSITGLNLRIDLPQGVDYMSSVPSNPTRSGNTLVFNLGTLRANGEGSVSVRVRVREDMPMGAYLNFPAVLSYVDPSGYPQSVSANVSAQVWSDGKVVNNIGLGAGVFGAGFLPNNIFGWLILIILILVLVLLAKYLFRTPVATTIVHTNDPHAH